jgi:ribosomal-protein-alanine N-acetyltransferase
MSFRSMLELTGQRVLLREFTKDHLHDPIYFSWLRDLEVVIPIYRTEYLLPLHFDQVVAYVESLWKSGKDCLFAVHDRATGAFVGTQRIGHIDWRSGVGDIGVLIGERQAWGRGVATEAVSIACNYAFQTLGLRRLTGGTPASNEAMCRCFKRLGFEEEGRLREQLLMRGKYEDHLLFGLLKDQFKKLGDQVRS